MPISDQVKADIAAGNVANVTAALNNDPGLLNQTDGDGNSLLHLGARDAQMGVIQLLTGRGLTAALINADGDTPLHAVCGLQTAGDPANIVTHLLGAGGNLATTNAKGWTAVHTAAFSGKVACMTAMSGAGGFAAAVALADARGWTPMDIAGAGGRTAIEDYLVNNGHAAAPALALAGGGPHSTVDVILAATKAEQPALLADMRGHLEELYRNPDFRPVLDMAAADALQSRAPGGGGRRGLRVYLGATDFAGAITGRGGYGAFDDRSNTLALGAGRPVRDLVGTIIHEMTHHAADVVYGAEAVPYAAEGSAEANAYQQAIADDVKIEHYSKHMPGEMKEVSKTIIGRVPDYSFKAATPQDKRLRPLQEFIAGVPQSIYENGESLATDVAPNLVQFFKNQFKNGCANARANHLAYQATVNNTNLIAALPPLPPPVPVPKTYASLTNGTFSSDLDVADLLIDDCRVRHGVPPAPAVAGPMAGLAPILFSPNVYQLPEDANDALKTEKRRALRQAVADLRGEFPPEMSKDRMTKFLKKGGDAFHNNADGPTASREMKIEGRKQLRKARLEYIERAAAQGTLTPQLIAETTAYEAACQALENDAARGLVADPTLGPDMNDKKLKKLVKMMARRITPLKLAAYVATPGEINNAVASLTGAGQGVFTKDHGRWQNKVLRQSPEHVNLKQKDARRAWVAHLATL